MINTPPNSGVNTPIQKYSQPNSANNSANNSRSNSPQQQQSNSNAPPTSQATQPAKTTPKKYYRDRKKTTIRNYRNKMKPTYELLQALTNLAVDTDINATRINVSNKFEEMIKPEYKKPEYNAKTKVKNTIDNNIPGLDLDNLTNKLFDIVPIDQNKQIATAVQIKNALNKVDEINNLNKQAPNNPKKGKQNAQSGGQYSQPEIQQIRKDKKIKKALVKAISSQSTVGEIPYDDKSDYSDDESIEERVDADTWKEQHPNEYSEVEFQKIVDLLENKVNIIITHPIMTKIKSLKAKDVCELSRRTVIYEDENKDSFFPTKELIDSIMNFLFVDYTSLDVYKQIFYYYKTKMDKDSENGDNTDDANIAMNVIQQQIYTHSGIMQIIDTLLNKFTYIDYYPLFIEEKDFNDRENVGEKVVSLLEKDTEYYRIVSNRDNKIDVMISNGDKIQKFVGEQEEIDEDTKDKQGGQTGGEAGEDAVQIALSVANSILGGTLDINNTQLKEVMPTNRKYIYIKRFISLINEFTKLELNLNGDKHRSNRYIQKMLSVIILNHVQHLGSIMKILNMMMNSVNHDFFEVLNYLVRIQNSKLITFVKVNNYNNKSNLDNQLRSYNCKDFRNRHKIIEDYNRRFEIFVNNPNISDNWRLTDFVVKSQQGGKKTIDELRTGLKTLVVKYNDDDFPYYDSNNPTYVSKELLVMYNKELKIQNKEGKDVDCNDIYLLDKDKGKFDIKKVEFITKSKPVTAAVGPSGTGNVGTGISNTSSGGGLIRGGNDIGIDGTTNYYILSNKGNIIFKTDIDEIKMYLYKLTVVVDTYDNVKLDSKIEIIQDFNKNLENEKFSNLLKTNYKNLIYNTQKNDDDENVKKLLEKDYFKDKNIIDTLKKIANEYSAANNEYSAANDYNILYEIITREYNEAIKKQSENFEIKKNNLIENIKNVTNNNKEIFEKAKQTYDEATDELKTATETYNTAKLKIDEAKKTYDKAKKTYDKATETYNKATQEHEEAKKTYDKVNKSIKDKKNIKINEAKKNI